MKVLHRIRPPAPRQVALARDKLFCERALSKTPIPVMKRPRTKIIQHYYFALQRIVQCKYWVG